MPEKPRNDEEDVDRLLDTIKELAGRVNRKGKIKIAIELEPVAGEAQG